MNLKLFYIFPIFLCSFAAKNLGAQHTTFWQPAFEHLQTADNFYSKNACIGGLGNPQFSTMDIDNDGKLDLVIFDRMGNKWLTFKNEAESPSQKKYIYKPEWQAYFPEVEKWALLRDYNCDGLEDIICHSRNALQAQIGIGVYKAHRAAQTQAIYYTLEEPILMYKDLPSNNIYNIGVAGSDLPCIDDIDGDGDLDILTFNDYGGYLEFFQNQSMERGYGCDSLIFEMADNCWGRFYESGMSEIIDLSPRVDSCANYRNWSPIVRHPGSTVATFDYDNDGDKDLFLGDISYNNITMLRNGGSTSLAFADEQIVFFPQNTVSVDLQVFPAAFFLDINNDGKKDLIVSPNIEGGTANVDHVWYYLNNSTNDTANFQFAGRNFILENSLDFGNLSFPTFSDIDGDGDLDLVVASGGYYMGNNNFKKSLFAYEQIGTENAPIYKLKSDDYANLSQYNFEKMAPTFADLDGDGDKDILLGLANGTLVYVQNRGNAQTANYATPIANYAGIDVGNAAVPTLFDLDGDGDLDLVVGETNGNLNYFENTGTRNNPQFASVPTSDRFGYIDARVNGVEGYTAPFLYEWNGTLVLFLGRENGDILIYNNLRNNLLGTFDLVDIMPSVKEGKYSSIGVKPSANNNSINCFVGNWRGGLSAYTYTNANINIERRESTALKLQIFPNPNKNGDIYIQGAANFRLLQFINIQGNAILPFSKNKISQDLMQLQFNDLPPGVYFLHLLTEEGVSYTEKIIII